LRQWPTEHPSPQRLQWIHEVLFHSQRSGVSVLPIPIRCRDGETFVSAEGLLWELAPWMPGQAREPETATPQHVLAAMSALAQFHNATATLVDETGSNAAAPAVTERLARIERWLHQGEIEAMEQALAQTDPSLARRAWPLIAAFRQLAQSVEQDLREAHNFSVSIQPCIRDIHHQHVLFVEDDPCNPRVSALIDFGAMRPDTVATDIARLMGSLACDDAVLWEAGLRGYQQQRPLSDCERLLALFIDRANVVLTGPQWLEWLLIEQKQFRSMPAILARLDRVLIRLKNLQDGRAVERRNKAQPG
jgi:Ser/Thr protein kinase RdoA (MazF antagonist)